MASGFGFRGVLLSFQRWPFFFFLEDSWKCLQEQEADEGRDSDGLTLVFVCLPRFPFLCFFIGAGATSTA